MRDFFERRDWWGNGLALWVVIGMAFIAPIAAMGLSHVELENNVADWLAPDNLQARMFRWYEDHFAHDDSILASWEGSRLHDPRIAKLSAKLIGVIDDEGNRRGGLQQVSGVRTPNQLIEQMEKYDVDHEEAVQRVAGVLISWGKLRVRLTSEGRKREQAVRRLLTDWARHKFNLDLQVFDPLPEAEFEPAAADDPSDEIDADELFAGEHDFRVSWTGMKAGSEQLQRFREQAKYLRWGHAGNGRLAGPLIEDCFLYPESPIALAISLSESGLADKGGTLAAIRQTAQDVGIPPEQFHLAGRAVASSALNQAVIKTSWNEAFPIYMLQKRSVILLSGLIGILLTFYLLRSWRLGTLVLIVSYFAPLVTVAMVPVTGGSMNMVLIVMPTLLLVLTISGSVHVANYWKHTAARNMQTAVTEAAKMAREPCLLAGITTAIGLLSLMTSHLTPVRDFGFYSAVGILFSLALVLYGLPSLLSLWPPKQPRPEENDHTAWQQFATWIAEHSTAVTSVSLILCVLCTAGLWNFQTETKVIKYFDESTRVYRDYAFMEDHLSGVVPVEVIVKFSADSQNSTNFAQRAELVRQAQERIRQIPDVSGTLSLADFLPRNELPSADASRLKKFRYNADSKVMEKRVKDDKQHRAQTLLLVADDETDFNSKGDELWRITAQVAILSDLDYGDLTEQLDKACAGVLRFEPTANHIVTGMVPLFLETQQEVLLSLIRSFCLAFAVIAVVLMFVLKHPLAGLIAMLPNVLPIGMVFGLISWNGVAVDIGTMITASVALGIAVDGTLHLLTWFRNGILAGKSRQQSIAHALGHCGPAMWQTSLVTGLGMIVFLPAELLLISRFGWLMSALIGMALVADIVLLPALLAGPLGHIIEKTLLHADQTLVQQKAATTHKPHLVSATADHNQIPQID